MFRKPTLKHPAAGGVVRRHCGAWLAAGA